MSETSENFPKIPIGRSVHTGDPQNLRNLLSPISRERFIEQALVDYESPLIGYASTILNDIDQARDVVQETFTRLCQQDVAKVRENLKAWLFTVCRNRALDILRKQKSHPPLEEVRWKKVAGPGLQPDEHADQQERAAKLTACLSRLTDNQRTVIILKFQQGLSYQDIKKITGLTTGNIGFLIHTGLKRMRKILPEELRPGETPLPVI